MGYDEQNVENKHSKNIYFYFIFPTVSYLFRHNICYVRDDTLSKYT